MKQYEQFKKTNVTWLPEIPAHWEMSKAKYYFNYTTGFTPPTGVAEFYDGDITWITIADMNQKVVFDSATKLSQIAIDKYNPALTLKGSLLYSFKLSVGKVAYAGKDLYTNEAIISILPNKKYDLRYFYYALPEHLLQNSSENIYGAKILNQELIRNASICFPPKEEQIVIANYLDEKTTQIDAFNGKKKELIKLLKNERMAIISEAVNKGINSDVKLKPTKVEWVYVPAHWNISRISYIAKVVRGASPRPAGDPTYFNGDHTPWITVGELTKDENKYLTTVSEYLTEEGAKQSRFIELGTLLLSNIGATLGVPKILKIGGCINDGSVAFLNLSDKVVIDFLYYFFKSLTEIYRDQMSGYGQPNLNSDIVKETQVCYPETGEQLEIVKHIETRPSEIAATISKVGEEIKLLQEYRTSLLSEAATGKIKVM